MRRPQREDHDATDGGDSDGVAAAASVPPTYDKAGEAREALSRANVNSGALWVQRGLTVFPIAISWDETKGKTNKRPLTDHGFKDATGDLQELMQLVYDGSTRLRGGEILACALVPGSGGYVVFDGDIGEDKDGVKYLEDVLRLPPHTYRPVTGSGGEHRWYRKRDLTVPVSNVSPWGKDGVDIRSDAGYVVCPGTVTPWGNWTDGDEQRPWGTLAMVPESIWNQLTGGSKTSTAGGQAGGGWKRYDPATHDPQLHPATVEVLRWLTDAERGERRVDPATVTFCTRDGAEPYLQTTRPGKGEGVSATVGFVGPGVLYVFSSKWPGLNEGTAYDLFDLIHNVGEQGGGEHRGGEHRHDAKAADALFTRDGLQVASLAEVVKGKVTHGRGQDGRLWAYDAGVWQPDIDDTIPAAITTVLGERYRRSHLTNVLDVLRFDQGAPRIHGDPVGEYVNLTNGLYDWRTGRLHPHDPAVLSTVQLPVPWRNTGECPAVIEFLKQVLPADCIEPTADSPGFIWELIGYILMSGNPLHTAILLFGSGRNGKGTFLRLLLALIGERNVSSVALHDLVSNRFRVATLFGKLANIAGDLDSKWLESTALFKAITGGDQVQAELKYGATWDFVPWAVPVFSANKAFGSPDSSEGYFSRWTVVPFPNTFVGKEDRNLTAKITTEKELAGVLHKAMTALPILMGRGRLPEPVSVAAAKHEFIVASDPVRAWIAERVDLGDGWTPRTVLNKDFKAWCEVNDHKTMSASEFYNRLDTVSSVRKATIGGARGYRGITLQDGAE